MEFDKAIKQIQKELLNRYKDVVYVGYKVVHMTKNTTTSSYIEEQVDIATINVTPIKNRFEEIDGEIKAIEVVFDVKLPRKRKYNRHKEYFRIK